MVRILVTLALSEDGSDASDHKKIKFRHNLGCYWFHYRRYGADGSVPSTDFSPLELLPRRPLRPPLERRFGFGGNVCTTSSERPCAAALQSSRMSLACAIRLRMGPLGVAVAALRKKLRLLLYESSVLDPQRFNGVSGNGRHWLHAGFRELVDYLREALQTARCEDPSMRSLFV